MQPLTPIFNSFSAFLKLPNIFSPVAYTICTISIVAKYAIFEQLPLSFFWKTHQLTHL